jgi:hypothetical protein
LKIPQLIVPPIPKALPGDGRRIDSCRDHDGPLPIINHPLPSLAFHMVT